ncbi:hypothetical protein IQ274_31000 [Nostoc sp. LEGE 12447]|nr:hypothetical protein [Nostoc sp. LEGE 12447]MBE9002497.1 hypothetical protein [Nostoc sp. LEGE 12447]
MNCSRVFTKLNTLSFYRVTVQELDTIAIERNSFHGEWNYIIKPQISP